MSYHVVMPQLGMTMTEGSVLRWLKNAGERVEKGEPLFEVQTDKVEMEVEAPCSGVLAEILVPLEHVVPVGSPLATIAGADGEDVETAPVPPPPAAADALVPPTAGPAVANAPPQVLSDTGSHAKEDRAGERRVSPRARRLADERGVSLAELTAWKQKGRIVEANVRSFLSEQVGPVVSAPSSQSAAVRQAIATRMANSFREVPHFYLSAFVDATELSKLRQQLLPVVEEQAGVRLSYLDLLLRASALALRRCPEVNAYWDGSRAVAQSGIHVGFAAQFADRLLTPVVRDAGALAIGDLARTRAALVERGRAGKLSPRDIEEATFTVSNLGPFGVDQFQAIVVPPQSAILAVGRIAPRPMVVGNGLQVRETVWLTLSIDHRILDGAAAASFLAALVSLIESPYRLLLSDR